MWLRLVTEKKFMTETTTNKILDLFSQNLPKKPYCSDDLNFGLKIYDADIAIKKRYIQHNKPTDLRWLVYDIDRPTGHFDWQDLAIATPNFSVMNRANGHAHLFYGLEIPVFLQTEAKRNPIRYVSSIDVAMTEKLDADANYSKLICKNPFNEFWQTYFWRDESYGLSEIADWLDLSYWADKRRKLPEIGLGRNCNLFDLTRFWAYREIRKPPENYLFREMYSQRDFVNRCISFAVNHNSFEVKLPVKECETIGTSVGKWVYRNMSPKGFQEWGDKRRQRSIDVRHGRSMERAAEAQELASRGYNQSEIAKELGLSQSQVSRLLKLEI